MKSITNVIRPRRRRLTGTKDMLDDTDLAMFHATSTATMESTGSISDSPLLEQKPSYERSVHYAPLYDENDCHGLPAYLQRTPLHSWDAGYVTSQRIESEPPVDHTWQADQQTASVHSECVPPGHASLFSSELGLLKRVSSTPGNMSLFRASLVDPFSHPEFRAPPRYTRHQPVRLPVHEPDDTPLYGYALLATTSTVFFVSIYALIVSKFMPYTGIRFLDMVKEDDYYCLLVPITGLSFIIAVFWNWLGMKFFRHN